VIYNDNSDTSGGFTSAAAYELPVATGAQTQTWTIANPDEHAFAAVSFQMVPEPASASALIGLGLLLLRRRRRRD